MRNLLSCLVVAAMIFWAALAVSSCGKDGEDGAQGEQGVQGNPGEKGEPGAAGSVVTIGEVDGEWWWYIDGVKTDHKVTGASGEDGANGTVVTIIDGYWAFDGVKSEYKAVGENGLDGENIVAIEISTDGYWIINGEKTNSKAIGVDGSQVEIKDGVLWINGEATEIQVHECIKTFTLIFDADNGSPNRTQTVLDGGWAIEPKDPTKGVSIAVEELPAGLYAGITGAELVVNFVFNGWFEDGEDEPFDFENAINRNITLTAKWTEQGLKPIDISAQPEDNVVEKAIAYIKANPEIYTLLIDEDVDIATQELNAPNVSITIIGLGGERKINLKYLNHGMFIVNSTVKLAIGNNVVLVGRNSDSGNISLITVRNGAEFIMFDGSKITGHAGTNMANIPSAVYVSGGTFIMQGGEITGNAIITSDQDFRIPSGVFVASNSYFNMEGGIIRDNNNGYDVSIARNGYFTITGNAEIGNLTLTKVSQFITV